MFTKSGVYVLGMCVSMDVFLTYGMCNSHPNLPKAILSVIFRHTNWSLLIDARQDFSDSTRIT